MSGRLPRETRVYDLLDQMGIEYERFDHEPATTMEACEAIDAELGVTMCKNLFLCNRQKTNFYLLLMPGDKKFKTKELSAQINSARLSFAGPEEMLRYLDIEPGAASVMGLMNDREHGVKLLIDQDYWRGRVWAPMNFLTYLAFERRGLKEACRDLAEKSLRIFEPEWKENRHVHENYNAITGEGCDVPSSDKFYHWGALLTKIALRHAGNRTC